MRKFWVMLLVLWPALGWGFSASAPLSATQQKIVLAVQSPAGFVDEPLYRQFWGEFPDSFLSNPLARPMLSSALLESVGVTATYGEQLWVSVERSLASGRVERTEELVAVRGRLRTMQTERGRLPEEILAAMGETLRLGDEVLRAAAAHRPVRLEAGGPEVVLTAEMARVGRSQAQAVGLRLRQLFAPGYEPMKQRYRLPQAAVEFSAPCALAEQPQSGAQVSLQCLPQRDQVVMVQIRPVSPERSEQELAACATLPGSAASPVKWLGGKALQAQVALPSQQQFAVRCVYRPKSKALLSLAVLAPQGQALDRLQELSGAVRPLAP